MDVMSSSRSAQRCSAVVSWARVGRLSPAVTACSAAGRSTQPRSEDQRRTGPVGCWAEAGCGAEARPAMSLGVGTTLSAVAAAAGRPLATGTAGAGPAAGRTPGAGTTPGGAAGGAARILAISWRGPGAGKTVEVSRRLNEPSIHSRSSTRRSSASPTRSSDWLKSPSAAWSAQRWTTTPCSLADIMPGSRSPSPVISTTSAQARLRASSESSACIAASTPFCTQRPSARVRAPSRTVTRGRTRRRRCSGIGRRSGAASNQ